MLLQTADKISADDAVHQPALPKIPFEHNCWQREGTFVPYEEYVRRDLLPDCFKLKPEQIDAVVKQYGKILGAFETLSVRHVHGWTFPDGAYFPLPYFVFRSGPEFGIARISHGMLESPLYDIPRSPFCVIEMIQGIKGVNSRELPIKNDARTAILHHILRASGDLPDTGWTIALLKTQHSKPLQSPYFRPDIISTSYPPFGIYSSMQLEGAGGDRQYHVLDDPAKSRAVRRMLERK